VAQGPVAILWRLAISSAWRPVLHWVAIPAARTTLNSSMATVSSLVGRFLPESRMTWPDAAATPFGVARRRAYTFKFHLSKQAYLQEFYSSEA
jgi:hypothetical protein